MDHLKYYKECLETGELKGRRFVDCDGGIRFIKNGLCHEPRIDKRLLHLFIPQDGEGNPAGYWAQENYKDSGILFNPLRQTIVLFIAAMKGQL